MSALAQRWLAPEAGPATLKTRPWGGERLAALRDAPPELERPIGESWEFSTLEGSESRAEGQALSRRLGAELPFLVKLIDTAAPLSVQLHPDDDPVHGRPGKEEAWIVLEAEPGASVLAGLRPEVDLSQLRSLHAAATLDPQGAGPALVDALQAHPVQTGSIVFVPARTLHAIRGGILLAEIQQPSDCTFRLFDYGSDRETHPQQVFSHIDPDAQPLLWRPGQAASQLRGNHLELESLVGPVRTRVVGQRQAPQLIVAVRGQTRARADDEFATLEPGQLRLLHAGAIELELEADAIAVVGRLRDPG